jgi:hypothetical protein
MILPSKEKCSFVWHEELLEVFRPVLFKIFILHYCTFLKYAAFEVVIYRTLSSEATALEYTRLSVSQDILFRYN